MRSFWMKRCQALTRPWRTTANVSRPMTGRPIRPRPPPKPRSWLRTASLSRCFPDRRIVCVPAGPNVGRRRRSRPCSWNGSSSWFGTRRKRARPSLPKKCSQRFRRCWWVLDPDIVVAAALVSCWMSSSRGKGISSWGAVAEAPGNDSVPSSRSELPTCALCRVSSAGRSVEFREGCPSLFCSS